MNNVLLSSVGQKSDLDVASSSGYGGHICEQGIPLDIALLSLLAAFGVSFAILYMASTTNTGRKKRSELSIFDQIQDIAWKSKILLRFRIDELGTIFALKLKKILSIETPELILQV